jgi:DNA-binding NarL/FixJ family response regulator
MRNLRSRWEHDEMARRVLLVDDHEAFRAAARALLESEGFVVVGDAATGADAVRLSRALEPDVVLLDVRLPDVDGITVATELAALVPRPMVVLVSSRSAAAYGDRIGRAPVRGFLTKSQISGGGLRRVLTGQP